MKNTLRRLAIFALPALAAAAEPSPLRLAEATTPDWRGESGRVFAADRASIAIEADGSASPVAMVRRSPDLPWFSAPLTPDPAATSRWLLDLPEPGWYDIRVSQSTLPAQSANLSFSAAVIGAPIPEVWREKSVFGIWNVNGDPALIRLAGARWNRRMTSFRDVTQEQAAEFGGPDTPSPSSVSRLSSLAAENGIAPYTERDGLAQVGVFSFGMPLWTMDMPEDVKLPSFGNPFYPAKDWDDVTRAVAAYARTHALPRDMSVYNEPLAHFKGQPAQIADYARAVRAGLLRADPSFRVGGPGLYSIHIANLTKIESDGLLDSLDFLDMHAYVGGTPPEKEFIAKIDMLKDWLAAHGRPDMPVYLTEFGWTAADGTWQPPVDRATQARYVARSLALAWSRGIDALLYFALDYRTTKAGEAAFSLIGPGGRPEAGYCAFAAVSRHFAASEPLGHFILAPGVHLLAGRRDGRFQFMAWREEDTPPCEVALPFAIDSARYLFGSPAQPAVNDAVAKVFQTHCQGAVPERLHAESVAHFADLYALSPSPIFLETERVPEWGNGHLARSGGTGVPPVQASAESSPVIEILPPQTVMSLPDFSKDAEFDGFLAVGRYSKWLKSPDRDLPPAPTPPDGTYAAFVRRGRSPLSWAIQPYKLVSPATLEDVRLAWPADSPLPVLEAIVRANAIDAPVAVSLAFGPVDLVRLHLAPGTTETVRLPLADAKPGRRNRATFRLVFPDGSAQERPVEWTALPVFAAGEDDDPPWVDFSTWAPFGGAFGKRAPDSSGPAPQAQPFAIADCSAKVRLFHDEKELVVEVEVQDNEHDPSLSDPSRLWERDSIQLGFDMDPLKPWEAGFAGAENSQTLGGHRVFELSIAGAGDGPGIAYLERSWDDALPAGTVRPAIEVRVKRNPHVAPVTRYRVRIPWAELGAAESPPQPGEAIGFSLAVNDVDRLRGATRHGLTLFGGIVDDKDPRRFGTVWLRPGTR